MALKLKICGMQDPENILQVITYTPDYLGFIFYKPSPRYAGHKIEEISRLDIPASIEKVGVFVDESAEHILHMHTKIYFDLVQLHGDEPVSLCERLTSHGIRVIKVFPVGSDLDFELMKPYADVVDFFLFDTLGKYYGGNSLAFNWDLLQDYPFGKPFFLGGGVGPDNIQAVERLRNPCFHAVDANSRLESIPGIKDLDKIRLFKEKFNKLKI